jgi:RNA polymerase sigma factor (TIGR02999 family)
MASTRIPMTVNSALCRCDAASAVSSQALSDPGALWHPAHAAMLVPVERRTRRLPARCPRMPDLTRFLHAVRDDASPDELAVAALYDEIRRRARSFLRSERPNHTLAPTALANEAWLRLFGGGAPAFETTAEFVAAAVTTLRRVLVDHGRRRARLKRGGDRKHRAADADQLPAPDVDERLLAVDEALQRLAAFDPGKARLVELRFFGGLSVDEAAKVLGQSPRTTARDWRVARAFLRSQLQDEGAADDVDD